MTGIQYDSSSQLNQNKKCVFNKEIRELQIGKNSIFEINSIVALLDPSAKITFFHRSSFNWIAMILWWKCFQQKLRSKFLDHIKYYNHEFTILVIRCPLFIIVESWYKWFYTLHLLMVMWNHCIYATAHVLILNGHETAVSIFKNMRFNNNFYCEIRKT